MPMRNGSRLTVTAIIGMVIIHNGETAPGRLVQAGELGLPVLLDAGSASDLAARRDRDRAGGDENEVGDGQSMRLGDRRRHVVLDDAEPLGDVRLGVAALLELD